MTIHTLYELVQHSVKSFASKVAFAMYGGEELSYAEVGTRVKHVQDLLIGAGLKAGDKVALLSSNMPNWCVSYLAVTSAGMVAVPILRFLDRRAGDDYRPLRGQGADGFRQALR